MRAGRRARRAATASMPGTRSTRRNCSATRRRTTTRSPTSSTSGSTPASPTNACSRSAARRPAQAGRPVPGRLRPASRLVPVSSLLTGVAIDGVAPYRQVLTHGFTVDAHGRKMSKSLGNVLAPQKVIEDDGRRRAAPVDRLDRLPQRDVGVRRDPQAQRRRLPPHPQHRALPARQPARLRSRRAHLRPLERHGRARPLDRASRRRSCSRQIVAAYERYDFAEIVQALSNFCSVDLGSLYLDVTKDRLYTMPEDSRGRRSAQSAMFRIAEAFVRWIAPILSFTADEIWRLPAGRARGQRAVRDLVRRPGAAAGDDAALSARGLRSPAGAARAGRPRCWSRCAPPARSAPRWRPRSRCAAASPTRTGWRRSPTNCASCSSAATSTVLADDGRKEIAVLAAPTTQGASACAAGTTAPMSAAMPRIRRCAVAA